LVVGLYQAQSLVCGCEGFLFSLESLGIILGAQSHQSIIAEIQAIAMRYQDTVALFAALGGGWWNAERRDGSVSSSNAK
jgi:hypothetical protein